MRWTPSVRPSEVHWTSIQPAGVLHVRVFPGTRTAVGARVMISNSIGTEHTPASINMKTLDTLVEQAQQIQLGHSPLESIET